MPAGRAGGVAKCKSPTALAGYQGSTPSVNLPPPAGSSANLYASMPLPSNGMVDMPAAPDMGDARWLDVEFYKAADAGFNKYDPMEWLPTIRFHVSTFMFKPWFAVSFLCLAGTAWVEFIAPEHREWFSAPLDAHTIMGAALSFLVVMRTDTSMDRWWDARSSWATIGNCVLSISAHTAPMLRSPQATEQLLMQLMAFLVSLKAHLRDAKIEQGELGPRMDWNYCKRLNSSVNPPLQALKAIMETVRGNMPEGREGKALGSAIFDETSEQVRAINQAVGTCLKIKSTPMTLGYVTTLRSILLLWLATLPVALIGEFGWLATPIIAFIAFLFLNVEQMAVEIEQPFGDDANDLPQESYIVELEEQLLEMLPGFELGGGDDEGGGATWSPGGSYAAGPAHVGHFIAKYRMTPEMSEELLGLLQGGGGGGPPMPPPGAAAGMTMMGGGGEAPHEWNNVSPAWRQQTRGRGPYQA